ncbi:hypothetical protein LWI28_028566 [Acer negundo]|uniref:Uncharacterized protein n=1 Tax=Acer negundo TaxID=4023 RepID=A0AAD5NQZ6_ACENE|nr:hypothetical protein LWI28_028566 [Acer negundo]
MTSSSSGSRMEAGVRLGKNTTLERATKGKEIVSMAEIDRYSDFVVLNVDAITGEALGGKELRNMLVGPALVDQIYGSDHMVNVSMAHTLKASLEIQSVLDPSSPSSNSKEGMLTFAAKDTQFNLGDSNLIGKWKPRTKNNHRVSEQKIDGSILGKKKSIGANRKIFEFSKKQRYVSSTEDSAEVVVEEVSAGRFQPACRAQ